MKQLSSIALCVLVATFACWPVLALSPQQNTAQFDRLNEKTRAAGKLYSDNQMDQAAKLINEIYRELSQVLKDQPSPAVQRAAEPIYQRIARAHALLELEGVELDPLKSWEDLVGKPTTPDKPAPPSTVVSFTKDVAPILVNSCGSCHIAKTSGKFSMANYDALMLGLPTGKIVNAGSASASRLIEVIESGSMPPDGERPSDSQLATLKQWIDQGAKFDGTDPKHTLSSNARSRERKSSAPASTPSQPKSDSSTVSFARDVAPILRENCVGCHIGGQQASGGLRMDTFSQLMRGGGSGTIIEPPKDSDSLLIQKLKGQAGQRMPAGGRPPLAESQIQTIATWIREGASFDGPTPNTNINTVISTAWASSADHEQLFKRRSEKALEKWRQAIPNDPPSQVQSDELFILGNVPQFRIEEIQKEVERSLAVAKKQFSVPTGKPLIRGGLVLFVLKSRYDYSEFGKMTEKRELPKHWLGHWNADPVEVYCVLSGEDSSETPLGSIALQVITAAFMGSHAEVPRWFSEGVGRNMVATHFKRSDTRAKEWAQSVKTAAQTLPNAQALLNGSVDEETGGMVGMAITGAMMSRNNKLKFNALTERLQAGTDFNQAMTATYGKPEDVVRAWIGK